MSPVAVDPSAVELCRVLNDGIVMGVEEPLTVDPIDELTL